MAHLALRSSAAVFLLPYTGTAKTTEYTEVATAAFWRTFSDEGKISPSCMVRVGGARPPPLFTFTITSKVAVYAPAEWANTLTLFHL